MLKLIKNKIMMYIWIIKLRILIKRNNLKIDIKQIIEESKLESKKMIQNKSIIQSSDWIIIKTSLLWIAKNILYVKASYCKDIPIQTADLHNILSTPETKVWNDIYVKDLDSGTYFFAIEYRGNKEYDCSNQFCITI